MGLGQTEGGCLELLQRVGFVIHQNKKQLIGDRGKAIRIFSIIAIKSFPSFPHARIALVEPIPFILEIVQKTIELFG